MKNDYICVTGKAYVVSKKDTLNILMVKIMRPCAHAVSSPRDTKNGRTL